MIHNSPGWSAALMLLIALPLAPATASPHSPGPPGLSTKQAPSAPEQGEPGASDVHAQRRERIAARERALGLERVAVGPNQFQFALPADLETPDVIERNGLISIYEGQSTFEVRSMAPSPRMVMQRAEVPTSPVDDMIGSLRVDEYGRRWRTVAVDRGPLEGAIRRYDDLVARTFGEEPDAVDEDPFSPRAAEGTEEGLALWRPLSWTRTDCDGDGEHDLSRYGADGRTRASNPMTTQERKTVLINRAAPSGSGVMVDGDTVLTAAHVVTDASGNPHCVTSFEVWTRGNSQAGATRRVVTDITVCGGYSGDGDWGDDYALLHLDSSAAVGWMAISRASNSVIRAADCHNDGYPSWTPGCGLNLVPGPTPMSWGVLQFGSSGDLFATTSKRVKTRVDAGPGHSGGPFYYFPSGCCGAHFVTGLLSGHVNLLVGKDYTGGPKGSAIRSWVIANM